jgi:hypothetical protein
MELQEEEGATERVALITARDEVSGALAVDPCLDAREHALRGVLAHTPQEIQADVHEHLADQVS